MIRKSLIIVALLALTLSACKKDKDDDDPVFCANYGMEYAEVTNAVYAAMLAYASNPTHETCVAYKDAYQDFIDALEKYKQCALWTPAQKAELQDAIDEAEENLNTLCDE